MRAKCHIDKEVALSTILPPAMIYIIYFLLFLLALRVLKSVFIDPYIKYKETQYRTAVKAAGGMGNNPFMKYQTLGEALNDMEKGQIASMADVQRQLEKDGIDPIKDPGFQKMMNTRDRLTSWKTKVTGNPLLAVIDQTGFPIVKSWIPEIEKAGKKWLKDW